MPVTRGTVVASIAVSGAVDPAATARLAFGTTGTLAQLNVKVGDTVTAGQVLARLDEADLTISVAQAEASLAAAQAKYEQTLSGALPEDIAIARNAVDSARTNLTEAERGAAEEVADAEADVRTAEADYRQARGAWSTTVALVDAALDEQLAGIAAVHADVLALREDLIEILRPGDVTTARDQLNEAALALRTARDFMDTALLPQRAELDSARALVSGTLDAFDRAIASGQRVDETAQAVRSAQPAYELAAGRLSTALDAASGQINAAQSSLDSARETLSSPASLPLSLLEQERRDLAAIQNSLLEEEQRAPALKTLLTRSTADLDATVAVVSGDHASARAALTDARAAAGTAGTSQASSLRSAELSLAKTSAGAKSYDIASAYSGILSAQAALQRAQNDLAGATLRAPGPGIVSAISAQLGEAVASGGTASPFITVVDVSSLVLRGTVGEAEVARLQPGQAARVVVDAVGTTPLPAKVTLIAPVATIEQGVPVYAVDITLDAANPAVRPGMSATADVVLVSRRDVLIVPNLAIRSAGGRRYVEVLRDGKPVRAEVTFGAASDAVTEVAGGLAEGDLVVLPEGRSTTTQPQIQQRIGPRGATPGGAPAQIEHP